MITLQETPYQLENLIVIRNGFVTKDYTIVGKVITFTIPFSNTAGAIFSEVCEIIYTY